MKKSFNIPKYISSGIKPIFAGALLASLLGVSAQAQTTWEPAGGGDWSTESNWDTELVPTSSNNVFFNTVTGTVNLTEDSATAQLIFQGAASNVTLGSTLPTPPKLDVTVLRFGQNSSNSTFTISGIEVTSAGEANVGRKAATGAANNANNNSLIISGAGSSLTVNNTFILGRDGTGGGSQVVNGNTVLVQGGGHLNVSTYQAGTYGSNNSGTISGAGSTLNVTNSVVLGSSSTGATFGSTSGNNLTVSNGATATVGGDVTLRRGALVVGAGSTVSAANFNIGLRGSISGKGTLVGNVQQVNVASGPGATAQVGETANDIGTLSLTGDWNNSNITLTLDVADYSQGAGVGYDLLAVSGAFTLGGNVAINLANLVESSQPDFRLISWNSFTGVPDDLNVTFLNGDALNYSVQADGLYIHAIPEPTTSLMMALGMAVLAFRMRRRR